MSELKVDKVSPRTGTYVSLNTVGMKNIIINGDMSIAQRGTSFADASTYTLDRFIFGKDNDGAVTITQSTDVPSGQGFAKSLKVDVTTADTSIGASQFAILSQRIEAQNLQYLKYGTANAETLTLSFWVKSNKTGTYCISLVKIDNTRYDYVAEYSISSADTWEKKTITIAPDSNIQAAGGAIDNDNGVGFYLQFALADGSSRQGTNNTWNTSTPATSTSNQVNFLDNTANEWFITGVQLEAGTTASDFEFLPVDVNLARCQRYYQLFGSVTTPASTIVLGSGMATNSNAGMIVIALPEEMRTSPSLTISSTASAFSVVNSSDTGVACTGTSANLVGNKAIRVGFTVASGLTAGNASILFCNSSNSAFIGASAEL
jgi:hypothetical protein